MPLVRHSTVRRAYADRVRCTPSSAQAARADTIASDPQLVPLSNHGGLTRTHALLATSRAVDRGVDTALTAGRDQRGPG
ncbi:choice-of-anchor Q domain-containing protein [Dokdonella soli]|uniref:choice-of-anchor Q domain-containing protein n=1 Tax=Dokdonella soli TaxID=529810 RepID=UPI003622B64A